MTGSNKQLGDVLDNISMLYELTLNVGSSLDLEENCRIFFDAMMSRCNFGFVALYLTNKEAEPNDDKKERNLIGSGTGSGTSNGTGSYTGSYTGRYTGSYTSPQSLEPMPILSASHPGIQQLQAEGAISHLIEESIFPELVEIAPLAPGRGILVAFALDDLGILFWINQTRDTAMANWELNPFRSLIRKFQSSIAACLDHEHLAKETARRIKLQQRVAQMQKMESLGVLAGGVAHDLNNILTPLALLPHSIRWDLKLSEDSPVNNDLNAIETAALQAAEMISDLLAMARSGGGRTEPVRLEDTVTAFQKSAAFRHASEKYPAIKTETHLKETGKIQAGNSAIGRLLLNLVTNAFEAMDGKGQVRICTREVTLDEEQNGYEIIPPGQYCLLEVGDNGPGIPEQSMSHVFEPFFSSKEIGSSGSGLGLAVVYGLVKDFAGYVDISTGSSGTCFHLYFPKQKQDNT